MLFGVIATCFFLFIENVASQKYSRESVQEKYPGFGTEWIPIDEDPDGKMIIGYLKTHNEERFSLSPEPSEVVTFTLCTRANPNGTLIKESISNYEIFDRTKPVKFITHGWMSSGSADTCVTIKDGFLAKYDANVFIMDWSAISGNVFYPIPMSATKSVGDFYAIFLNDIVNTGIDPKEIHLVGHSLGAHVSGFAARGVQKGKIGRVTGLDPALPGFDGISLVEGGRLEQNDAEFVDIIHTCGGYLGIRDSIGHADFYPNEGTVPQPGCGVLEMMEACSHGRSWKYFAESLVSQIPFMAYPCKPEDFRKCNKTGIPMGEPAPKSARGDYFLKTLETSPFAIKDIILDNNQNINKK